MKSESDFLRDLQARFTRGLPADILGIGDDAAVIERGDGMSWVVTTDMLVEEVDFLRARPGEGPPPVPTPESVGFNVGFKSLAVSLSDIAAMGAEPRFAFVSLGVPRDLQESWVRAFYDGFEEAMLPARVFLLGGDTSRVPAQIVVNVCVIGEVSSHEVKLRSSGRPGDVLFVSGALGDAAAGLELFLAKDPALQNFAATREGRLLVQRLERPRPHLAEGRVFATTPGVAALMDVSDGLAADLPKLLESSRCGARVRLENLPWSSELGAYAQALGRDPVAIAARGGEDFVLLGSCRAHAWNEVVAEFKRAIGRDPARIGELVEGPSVEWTRDGKPAPAPKGFDHFA